MNIVIFFITKHVFEQTEKQKKETYAKHFCSQLISLEGIIERKKL